MSISSKIALAMSADGASFDEVHNSLEKIADDFAIGFAEWAIAKNMGVNKFTLYEGELEIYKKEKGL